jgi:hypothetical protein
VKEYISQQSKLKLQILGVYQILGGLTGIVFNIWGFFTQLPIFGIQIIFPFLFFILFGYSVYCGTKCLKLDEDALSFSIYNQAFQVIGFAMFGFLFRYIAGFHLNINFDFTSSIGVTFDGGFLNFAFFYNQDRNIMKIEINLIAILLIFLIDWFIRILKKEKEISYSLKD